MIFLLALMAFAPVEMSARNIEIQAHRGSRFKKPENTLAAFEQAIRDGADSIECDIQVSADGVVFLAHDCEINGQAVKDIKYADVASPDTDTSPYQALTEVLQKINNTIVFDIEIKSDRIHTHTPGDLVEHTFNAIARSGKTNIRIRSFDPEVIRYTRLTYPSAITVYITDENDSGFIKQAIEVGAHIVAPHHLSVTQDRIRAAHQKGLRVIPWTANNSEEMERLIACRVDGITTDYPEHLKKLLS